MRLPKKQKREGKYGGIINVGISQSRYSRYIWYREWQQRLLPALNRFSPDLIFLSAGFDAHALDEINQGLISLYEEDFEWLTCRIGSIANEHCQGRIVSSLEGGYAISGQRLSPFARSVAAHLRGLSTPGSFFYRYLMFIESILILLSGCTHYLEKDNFRYLPLDLSSFDIFNSTFQKDASFSISQPTQIEKSYSPPFHLENLADPSLKILKEIETNRFQNSNGPQTGIFHGHPSSEFDEHDRKSSHIQVSDSLLQRDHVHSPSILHPNLVLSTENVGEKGGVEGRQKKEDEMDISNIIREPLDHNEEIVIEESEENGMEVQRRNESHDWREGYIGSGEYGVEYDEGEDDEGMENSERYDRNFESEHGVFSKEVIDGDVDEGNDERDIALLKFDVNGEFEDAEGRLVVRNESDQVSCEMVPMQESYEHVEDESEDDLENEDENVEHGGAEEEEEYEGDPCTIDGGPLVEQDDIGADDPIENEVEGEVVGFVEEDDVDEMGGDEEIGLDDVIQDEADEQEVEQGGEYGSSIGMVQEDVVEDDIPYQVHCGEEKGNEEAENEEFELIEGRNFDHDVKKLEVGKIDSERSFDQIQRELTEQEIVDKSSFEEEIEFVHNEKTTTKQQHAEGDKNQVTDESSCTLDSVECVQTSGISSISTSSLLF